MAMLTFREMLLAVRDGMDLSQQDFAKRLGYSSQHLCDLEHGRRVPSVAFVEKLCDYLSRGPNGRREWHLAAAEAHGWQVFLPAEDPARDKAIMGTPEAARNDLIAKTRRWREMRQPLMANRTAHRQRDAEEHEARFKLAGAALLWLWHEENPAPPSDHIAKEP